MISRRDKSGNGMRAFFALCALAIWVPAAAAAELVMLEADGCSWCAKWNEEVGVVYHKTPEGRRAPLRRVDIHGPLPADLRFLTKGSYTPTFILVDDGREFGRIRGYPGEEYFWALLGEMLKRLPQEPRLSETAN